ncbi:MAG: sterol desaturase family protein [Pseudomonadota bacterium]
MEFFDPITFFLSDFASPKKRVFVGYLFLAVLISLIWLLFIKRLTITRALARIFDRKVFFSRSAVADYQIFAINRVVTTFISPLLITKIAIATALFYALHEQEFLRAGHFSDASKTTVVALFSVSMFVIDDFTKYLVHRWMHRFPMLWAIHKIHHSAETLTPVTVYRVHPLEGVLYGTRSAVAQGIAISVFIYLFGDKVDLYTVVGVNILVFIFHVTGSNLRHSHINIHYWPWLEHILISPAQHQIHHSTAEEHFDRNFGAALAVWDWLFGSLHLSEADRTLKFGLTEAEGTSPTDLRTIYFAPFLEIARIAKHNGNAVRRRIRLALTSRDRAGGLAKRS